MLENSHPNSLTGKFHSFNLGSGSVRSGRMTSYLVPCILFSIRSGIKQDKLSEIIRRGDCRYLSDAKFINSPRSGLVVTVIVILPFPAKFSAVVLLNRKQSVLLVQPCAPSWSSWIDRGLASQESTCPNFPVIFNLNNQSCFRIEHTRKETQFYSYYM